MSLTQFLAAERHLKAGLEDQAVTSRGPTEADTKVQCHVSAKPQIGRRIELVPLACLAKRAVPLEPERHDSADVEPGARPWLELPFVTWTHEVTLDRGIGQQLQRAKTTLENRRQLGRPWTVAERRPRRLVFGAEPDFYGQAPRLRRPHPRAQPPPRVLETHARHLRAEDVAGNLPMIRDAARDLGGETPLALCRRDGPSEAARPAAREVEMTFQLPLTTMRGGVGVDGDFEMFLG